MTAVIAHATARVFEVVAHQTLRVTTPDGSQGGDLSFPGFDQSLTRNINGWQRYGRPVMVFHAEPGMRLYDGNGTAIFEVLDVIGHGRNDIVMPGCYREIYADGRPGCRDLISAALDIDRAQITGMLSFFVSSTATNDYYDGLSSSTIGPNDSIAIQALVDSSVAVSACPDTDVPGWRPGNLTVGTEGGY